jgi:hypothetical protein
MSYREKSAWVSLVTTLLVWGYFFVVLFQEVGSGDPAGGRLMGTFVACTVLIIILQIATAVVLAILNPKSHDAPADERERMFDLRASRIAFITLSILVMGTVLTIPVLAHAAPILFPRDPTGAMLSIIGGSAFFALVVGELVHAGGQILLFRRSA